MNWINWYTERTNRLCIVHHGTYCLQLLKGGRTIKLLSSEWAADVWLFVAATKKKSQIRLRLSVWIEWLVEHIKQLVELILAGEVSDLSLSRTNRWWAAGVSVTADCNKDTVLMWLCLWVCESVYKGFVSLPGALPVWILKEKNICIGGLFLLFCGQREKSRQREEICGLEISPLTYLCVKY